MAQQDILTPEPMNNELMEQCRREAEEVYPTAIPGIIDDWQRTLLIQAYAAALYVERSKRRELTDEASHHLFMGWLHANHGDINDSADMSDLCRRAFLDALRYARDNGYLAPAAGLTVERAMEVVKDWALDWCDWTMMEDGKYLRARLTEAAKH